MKILQKKIHRSCSPCRRTCSQPDPEEGRGNGVPSTEEDVSRSGAPAAGVEPWPDRARSFCWTPGEGGDAPEGGVAPEGAGAGDAGLPAGHVAGEDPRTGGGGGSWNPRREREGGDRVRAEVVRFFFSACGPSQWQFWRNNIKQQGHFVIPFLF